MSAKAEGDGVTRLPTSAAPPQNEKEEVIEALRPFLTAGSEDEVAWRIEALLVRSHRGPLPSASEFAGYERTIAGAAERILTMAESEQQHRHRRDNAIVLSDAQLARRGQLYAILAVLGILIVVGLFGFWGHAVAGASLGGAVMIGVVALFLGKSYFSTKMERPSEDEAKDQKKT